MVIPAVFVLQTTFFKIKESVMILSRTVLLSQPSYGVIYSLCQCGVWETLLAALEILIRVHHPHQVFNIRQFLKAEVVHRFLLTCQVLQVGRCHRAASHSLPSSFLFILNIVFVLRNIGMSISRRSHRRCLCHSSKSSRKYSGLLRTWIC